MTRTCYDPSLDEEILKLIDEYNIITFNILFTKLKENTQINSKTTLSKHLKFLEYKKIIVWRKNTRGKKGSIKFTSISKIQRKYGFLKIDYTDNRVICKEWKKKNEKQYNIERRRNMILFLLFEISYGYRGYKIPSKPQVGMIMIPNKEGKQIGISIFSEEGFSPNDLNRKKAFSPFQDLLVWNRFSKTEIKQIIDHFEKERDINFENLISTNNNTRYKLKDEMLNELLIWCGNILKIIIRNMCEYWYILSKKPKKEECDWFYAIVGKDEGTRFFQKIDYNRKNNKTIEELYREYKLNHVDDLLVAGRDLTVRDTIIKEMKVKSKKIFTEKKMKEELFTKAFSDISLIDSCNAIQKNEKIQKMIKGKKYGWILEELKYLINPYFLSKYYNIKLV